MTDSCGQCGYCCSYMGDILGILEDLGNTEFKIQYFPTGVEQVVRVDPDKVTLFSGSRIQDTRPLACPFLRERGDGHAICTVYQTRPELCRIYRCDRIKEKQRGISYSSIIRDNPDFPPAATTVPEYEYR